MKKPIVQQIFTGKAIQFTHPKQQTWMIPSWRTGIFKTPIEGLLWLGKTGLYGDEVGDEVHHGGLQKAVFVYPISHYAYWQEKLNNNELGIGGMGENFAVLGLDEDSVCIGDTYAYGEALIQVSQPRRPCWRPGNRHGVADLALQIQTSGRTGWYFRVLQTGNVQAGLELQLRERPYPQWTISTCNSALYDDDTLELARELAECELLTENWIRDLKNRIQ